MSRFTQRLNQAVLKKETAAFVGLDPRFADIQRVVEREIETRLGRLKTDRKKVRLAKARTQRQDIKDLSRNPVLYPIEMST